MFVSDILKSKGHDVVSVSPGDTVDKALSLIHEYKIGAVLVLGENREIAGILSERDLVRAMHEFDRSVFDKTVADLMTAPVLTCAPTDPIGALMGMMTKHRFRHLPVVEEGSLVGLVSVGDVVKSRIEEAQSEVEALRSYISL